MPPVHLLPHIVRAGGIPAGIGAVLALYLGWPHADPAVFPATYHSHVVGAGQTLEGAVGAMVALAIVLGLVGLGVGRVLVALGLAREDELGGE
jgi:hypothetical protein